jgi:hypothetical protein
VIVDSNYGKRGKTSVLTYHLSAMIHAARKIHIHQASMVDPRDYLSLTSPHPVTDERGEVFPTPAHYVAETIFRGLRITKTPRDLSRITPWDAMGFIYQVIFKGEHTRRVHAAVARALMLKVKDHKEVRDALMRTTGSKIVVLSDHQRICSSKKVADEQNKKWAEPYARILTCIRKQENIASEKQPIEPIYIVTTSLINK